jgi:hypothetical protein
MTNTNRPQDQNYGSPSNQPDMQTAYDAPRRGGPQRQGIAETAIKAFIRSIAGSLGRAIMRAIVGRR